VVNPTQGSKILKKKHLKQNSEKIFSSKKRKLKRSSNEFFFGKQKPGFDLHMIEILRKFMLFLFIP